MLVPFARAETSMMFQQLHPTFASVVTGISAGDLEDDALQQEIKRGMDEYAVLVFRDLPLTGAAQVRFAQQLDGRLHAMTTLKVLADQRAVDTAALTPNLDVDKDGAVLRGADRRRMSALGNRLWNTDASFVEPAGRYSMLSAQVVPPVRADTEFVDMRVALSRRTPCAHGRGDGRREFFRADAHRGH